MFGKPKKLGVGKPDSAEESIAVKKAVKKKYPQMSDPNWGKPQKKTGPIQKAVEHREGEQKSLEEALTPGELKRYGIREKYRNAKK